MLIDALSVLGAQLTRDLFAVAKFFLRISSRKMRRITYNPMLHVSSIQYSAAAKMPTQR